MGLSSFWLLRPAVAPSLMQDEEALHCSVLILCAQPAIFAIKMPIMYLRTQDNGVCVCV